MITCTKKSFNFGCAFLFSLAVIFSQNISAKEKASENMGNGMMGQGIMDQENMGRGMMGRNMMGQGMMGMCNSSAFENVKTNITETSDGVTIAYTAKDKKDIARIQKIAKLNKLSQELNEEEVQNK